MMKRRNFLVRLGNILVLIGFGVRGALAATTPKGIAPAGPGRNEWKALLNERFYLYDNARGIVTLTPIALRNKKTQPKLEQFTIIFLGGEHEPVIEGTYPMEHPKLGKFQLHLQPTSHDARGLYYRSEFNLLK